MTDNETAATTRRRHRSKKLMGRHRNPLRVYVPAPKLPPEQVRTKMLGVLVPEGEKLVFEAAAQAEGLSVSTWARRALQRAAGVES